jgi:uncharacterized membrane protein YjfL (UPF0719 family)
MVIKKIQAILLGSFLGLAGSGFFPALANAQQAGPPRIGIASGLVLSVVYGLVGIILLMVGYKVFELITPFSVSDALSKDQNRAVGIVVGSIFIGVAIIIAAALG